MQYLKQPKRAESILQTTEAVERWEYDARKYEQRFGKTLDEDVKIGVILALAPSQVQSYCHLITHILKSYAQVRTMLFDCSRAHADTAAGDVVPIDLSMLGESDQLKTVLGLYDMEIHQKISVPNYQKLKTMVRRSIGQKLRLRIFDARHEKIETGAVVKSHKGVN